MSWLTILMGVIGGAAIATQSAFSATLSKFIGLWPTTFLVHVVGVFVALLPLWFFRHQSKWDGVFNAPWYVFLGGAVGVVIIYSVAYVISNSSLTAGVSILIGSQLVMALLIDQFGWFGIPVRSIDWIRLLGVIFLFIGVRLVLR
jgi:transporter family-2 protein